MKIDVAIQSFKKPELLLYTLLSLKAHSASHIDTVWINDDGSNDEAVNFYKSNEFAHSLKPWIIVVRKNTHRVGWWYWPVKNMRPKCLSILRRIAHSFRCFIRVGKLKTTRHNIRYQWAIDNTDKQFIFLIHDDVFFKKDLLGLYLEHSNTTNQSLSLIGDLGQCWRCGYQNSCTPKKLMSGIKPSPDWPIDTNSQSNRWPCRINEWCCLLSVQAAKTIEAKYDVLFGNYENGGDIGAYWFYLAHIESMGFSDPLPDINLRSEYYIHADGGSGHSVWVDQGDGKKVYDANKIKSMLLDEFGFSWPND